MEYRSILMDYSIIHNLFQMTIRNLVKEGGLYQVLSNTAPLICQKGLHQNTSD